MCVREHTKVSNTLQQLYYSFHLSSLGVTNSRFFRYLRCGIYLRGKSMASVEDNILCHICVETRQNSSSLHTRGGYRQDLLENILSPLEKSLIVCCSCDAVMRDPQFTEEGYKCSSCLDGREGKPMAMNKTEIEKLRVACPFRK